MASVSFVDWVANFKGRRPNAAGCSPLERLPAEILNRILLFVSAPIRRKGWEFPHALPGETFPPRAGLSACLLVSRRLTDLALYIAYREPNIRSPKVSSIMKFFETLKLRPQLSSLVRTFDITRSGCSNYLISDEKLSRLPSLRDLRLDLRHVKDVKMLHTFIFGMNGLESLTLDVSRLNEKTSMLQGAFDDLPTDLTSRLTSLRFTDISGAGGLHVSGVLENLLPRMARLRVLDVSRTCVTVDALSSIPSSARLTHLNVWGCRDLDLDALIQFLTSHPAVKDSLITLKAGYIADAASMNVMEKSQINTLLSGAPQTLRSLDLSMSNMGRSNIPLLQKMCRQLEELSLGRGLEMSDIETMMLKPACTFEDQYCASTLLEGLMKEEIKHEAVLEPMKNAIALCRLRRRLDSIVPSPQIRSVRPLTLKYLNISDITEATQGQIKQSVLLSEKTMPLSVIEFADIPWEDFQVLGKICGAVGWKEKWEDKRVWVERSA